MSGSAIDREVSDGDTPLPDSCKEALGRLSENIGAGMPWPFALLNSFSLWTLTEEVYKGRLHRYVVQGEAFDLNLLAYRLLEPNRSLIPLDEFQRIFFQNEFSNPVFEVEIRKFLGPTKYQGYLNYWYGITVEIALHLAVLSEVRKDRIGRGHITKRYDFLEVYLRLYGSLPETLFHEFENISKIPATVKCVFGDSKEFIYWLFKLRLSRSEKERVASDTRKGLEWLKKKRFFIQDNHL